MVIGRQAGLYKPQVCLNLDLSIQPKHARIISKDEAWWIEDLDSPHGVALNQVRISQPMMIVPGDIIQLGQTSLTIEEVDSKPAVPETDQGPPTGSGTNLAQALLAPTAENLPENIVVGSDGTPRMICASVNAKERGPMYFDTSRDDAQERLSKLFDLPLAMAEEKEIRGLCQMVLRRITDMIPGAERGTFLVLDDKTNKLALRAGIPSDNPPISRTLIKRAAATGEGFIWNGAGAEGATTSIRDHSIASGLFAPLMWHDEIAGVISVDNPDNPDAFSDEDLRLFMAVAHYAAAAVRTHLLQHQLRDYSNVLEALLTNFSPKIRQTVVEKVLDGGLDTAGSLSNVTLLMSDFRGFTRVTQALSPHEIVEMLNDYFGVLVKTVFEYGGTIDKFIGDSILAVFGSPEDDPDQVKNALNAALTMQLQMRTINARREQAGKPHCDFGVGIHQGEVVHGFIGAEGKLEFTVIGDPVNKTARYCDGARADEILISREIHATAQNEFSLEPRTIGTKHEGDFEAWALLGQKRTDSL